MILKALLFILLLSNILFAATLNLQQGWNLVGINSQTTLQELKTQIGDENLLVVQGKGKTYKKTNPSFLNTFTGFEAGGGYWIKVANDSSLEFTPSFTPKTIQLQAGWNLIDAQELSLEDLKTQVGDENLLVIQGGGKTYKKTNQAFLNNFTAFVEPYGYWVKVQSDVGVSFGNIVDFDIDEILQYINEKRAEGRECGEYGYKPAVSPLIWSNILMNTALKHSIDMKENDFFSHTGSDGSTPSQRANEEGYNSLYVGENIAYGYPNAKSTIDAWIDSPGHCANIMHKNYTEVGMANSGIYWSMNLGTR